MNITQNFGSLSKKLDRYIQKGRDVEVHVGYTASYATRVHENIQMAGAGRPRRNGRGRYWDPQGRAQAKFLETPAREKQREIRNVVVRTVKDTGDLGQAVVVGGLLLQRESQLLVPVDTGNLKGSAFTKRVK